MENPSEHKTEQKPENKVKFTIQDYLSIGYLFLIVIGVFYETIYYKFLGINILEYSSVLDVLISPISLIAGNLILGVVVVLAILLGVGYIKLIPKYYKYLRTKKKYQEGKNKIKLDKATTKISSNYFGVGLIAFYVLCVFVGLGIGRGQKTSDRIKENTLTFTHNLIFEDGQQNKINVLGKNSLYIFYVNEGESEVSVSPIESNIKTIQKLKED